MVDGNPPASQYTAPISVSRSETIEAIASAGGYANSNVAAATYTVQAMPAATPTFSLLSGTYAATQAVTISDATPGTKIYYTTDATLPTTSSAVYSSPIQVSLSETILAIAVGNGTPNSAIASAVYTIGSNSTLGEWAWMGGGALENQPGVYGTLQTPAAANLPGARTDSQAGLTRTVTISLSSTENVNAIATAPGYRNSSVASALYIFQSTQAPVFSLTPGAYSSVQTLTLSDPTPNATIYYTTDGTLPVTTSPVYFGPITVSSSETITALAAVSASGYEVWDGIALDVSGNTISSVASATYILSLPQAAAPVFSIPLGAYSAAQTLRISDATAGATIYYTTNGMTPTTRSTQYSGATTISSSQTIEAIAVSSGYANSAVSSAVYTISGSPTFAFDASSTSLTVSAGGHGTVALTVTPKNGFSAAVTFACSGLPSGATCSFNPTTVTPSGSAATTQLTITASAQAANLAPNSRPFLPAVALTTSLCLFGWRRRRGLRLVLLLAVSSTVLMAASGCGSGTNGGVGGSTPSTSTVTLTATAGSLQQTSPILLTLN